MSVGVQLRHARVNGRGSRPLDDRPWRFAAVARPGMLALIVALTGAAGNLVQSWWWLAALGVVTVGGGVAERVLPRLWIVPAAEAAAAALVIGLGMHDAYHGLPYLLVPAFAGGLAGSWLGGLACAAASTAGLLVGAVLAPEAPFAAGTYLGMVPWMVLVLCMGLVGALVRRQQRLYSADVARYAAAYRLLSELRAVSRQLSGGLDAVTLATSILDEVAAAVPVRRSALLVGKEGGALVPLAGGGEDDGWLADTAYDRLAHEVMQTKSPTTAVLAPGTHRIAVPVRIGTRTIGVVVADLGEPVTPDELAALARSSDDGALRLETALLFDEIRELATREERHRLAREMHDGIAQELASLGYLVDDMQARATGPDLKSLAVTLRKEIGRILSDLRHSIFDLRSDVPADGCLGTSLARYARKVSSQTGLRVHLANDERTGERLQPEIEAELLRVGQEAINNVRKHAKARNLWVTVSVNPPSACIRVVDDGVGLSGEAGDRYGMDIMAERSRRVGATLVVEDRREGGTVVDVSLDGSYGKV
ncbi:MAG TPA: histidine kinase [Jiangellaceae bacterium]|nr:histidine kinase [Jiangellaceae bacterium]